MTLEKTVSRPHSTLVGGIYVAAGWINKRLLL